MSFFKRAMASMGVGSAKIDTVLNEDKFRAGDEFTGKIYVRGGSVEQHVNKIVVKLMTYYMTQEIKRYVDSDGDEREELIEVKHDLMLDKVEFNDSFDLQPKEDKDYDFAFRISDITPITFERKAVWIETELDIAGGIDSSDRDYIQILPHPYVQRIFDILTDKLGFRLSECEQKYTRFDGRSLPIVQEFEFKPTSFLHGQLDEIEIVFNLTSHGLEMFMEVDRKVKGFKGAILDALDLDESVHRIKIDAEDFENDNGEIEEKLCHKLTKYAQV